MIQRNFLLSLFYSLCLGAVLIAAPSEQIDNENEVVRTPVGERQFSLAEHAAIQEARSEFFKKDLGEEENEIEEASTPSSSMLAASAAVRAEGLQERPIHKAQGKNLLQTSHPGAFYKPFSVSLLGDTVELYDGSVWNICFDDRIYTLNWLTSDDIVIIPNTDWFSIYTYRLVNQQTGASVRANLYLGPINKGVFTYWIIAIDYFNGQICLSDGSIWSMSPVDLNIIKKWAINDTVMIGVNNGAYAAIRPNILINVNMNNYGMGNCLFY